MTGWFDRFARGSAHALATPHAFIAFLLGILAWHVLWWATGWEHVWVDRLTLYLSILTQATAQLIRYGEEASSTAQHAKLDTLIAGLDRANNALIGAEQKRPEEIRRLRDACGEAEDAR